MESILGLNLKKAGSDLIYDDSGTEIYLKKISTGGQDEPLDTAPSNKKSPAIKSNKKQIKKTETDDAPFGQANSSPQKMQNQEMQRSVGNLFNAFGLPAPPIGRDCKKKRQSDGHIVTLCWDAANQRWYQTESKLNN